MPKRNDGNEQDLRIRPGGKSLDGNNPMTGHAPEGTDVCEDGYGQQTDFTPDPPVYPQLLYDWQDVSDICPEGLSPTQVNRAIIRLLKNHFSDPNKIIDPNLKDYTYNTDPDLSELRIVMNTTFDTDQSGQLPAIVVKRGGQQMQRVVIDDFGQGGDQLDGRPHFVRFIQGSHRIFATATADGFIEALGFELFTLFNCYSPYLRRDLPFHDFQVVGLSELGLLDDLGATLGVAVEIRYAYEYGWTVREIGRTLGGSSVVTTVTTTSGG